MIKLLFRHFILLTLIDLFLKLFDKYNVRHQLNFKTFKA